MLCATLLSATLATLHIVINIRRVVEINRPCYIFAQLRGTFIRGTFYISRTFKITHTNDNDHKICYTALFFTNFFFKNIRKRRLTTLLYYVARYIIISCGKSRKTEKSAVKKHRFLLRLVFFKDSTCLGTN